MQEDIREDKVGRSAFEISRGIGYLGFTPDNTVLLSQLKKLSHTQY